MPKAVKTSSTRTSGAKLTDRNIAGKKPAKNTLNKPVKSTRSR
jgi:hypothetical protein